MNNLVKYGLIAAVIGGVFLMRDSGEEYTFAEDEIDLNVVLDVTIDSIHRFQDNLDSQYGGDSQYSYSDDNYSDDSSFGDSAGDSISSGDSQDSAEGPTGLNADDTFFEFAAVLQDDLNAKQPALYKTQMAVSPQKDASLLAYEDPNGNNIMDEGEKALFLIEIDGDNSRIIASNRSGAVNEHHFSGTSLLTGYLIGSMLSRQRGAGVSSKSLASKKPVTAKAAARSRAGSGSHSKGK